MTKYYVDIQGNYVGGFQGAEPPLDSIEVVAPPAHASHRWDGVAYAPVPPPTPTVVDMVQARLALMRAGHLATVNEAIAAMPGVGGDAARIEWEFRATVRRDSALTAAMATVLALDEGDLDALFVLAATL
jgi:hypothetical protein